MGLPNWLKPLVLVAKYHCGIFLWKNGNLGKLKHQGLIAFPVVDWVCYSFVSVNGVTHGEEYKLEFCGVTRLEVWQGKQWRRCQIKPIDRR